MFNKMACHRKCESVNLLAGIGPQGPRGHQGPQGPRGPQGIPGNGFTEEQEEKVNALLTALIVDDNKVNIIYETQVPEIISSEYKLLDSNHDVIESKIVSDVGSLNYVLTPNPYGVPPGSGPPFVQTIAGIGSSSFSNIRVTGDGKFYEDNFISLNWENSQLAVTLIPQIRLDGLACNYILGGTPVNQKVTFDHTSSSLQYFNDLDLFTPSVNLEIGPNFEQRYVLIMYRPGGRSPTYFINVLKNEVSGLADNFSVTVQVNNF